MAGGAILALDQGTTNSKALVINEGGRVVARASRRVAVHYPQSGWAEQDPREIWATAQAVIGEAAANAPDHAIAAIAISNQRESILLWDAATGEPLGPCILWQCRRSAERCDRLRTAGHEAFVAERSGLGLDPLFPAAKLGWLLDALPGARERARLGELRAGTVDSWLLWQLSGGCHATDHGNASRTQLMNLSTGNWDPDLAALFDVPLQLLGEIRSSDSRFAETVEGATALSGGVPIQAVMGDSHAALFGHGIARPGEAKVTIGTGSSLMMLVDGRTRSHHGLSETIAWSRHGALVHALEGNIAVSGQTAAFAVQLLGLANETELTALAATVPDSGGVAFVPALAGLGAPWWQADARGLIAGLSLGSRPAHVARAALDAIALQIGDVLEAMEADGMLRLPVLRTDGGASGNAMLMQLLADVIERPVVRSPSEELSALGAARMAAEALGWRWPLPERSPEDRFEPRAGDGTIDHIKAGWRDALLRTRVSATQPLD